MTKKRLLPRLAWEGIKKSGNSYLPYLAACIFSVFTYFAFQSILYNDLMKTLPKAGYAWVMMRIGLVLLGIILLPFLFYTNSFLIKKRGKELGLYSILGMERKHIGVMIALETLYIYLFVLVAGVLMGVVFSKLLFLLLLNLTGLSVDIGFVFYPGAFYECAVFWGIVSLLNLAVNLFHVGRANPIQMMRKSRKGEKETKGTLLLAVLGMAALVLGYSLSLTSKIDGFLFYRFFGAVFLVIVGTYFSFTWCSIVILRILKKNKGIYYKKENFITLSGMYSRMKKNAASLVNICVFATMVIITLLCTVSLYRSTPGMMQWEYPYDLEIRFPGKETAEASFGEKEEPTGEADIGGMMAAMKELAESKGVVTESLFSYRYLYIRMEQKEEKFTSRISGKYVYGSQHPVYFISLEDFNKSGGTAYELAGDEVLIFSSGGDFGYDKIQLEEKQYRIKEELTEIPMSQKAGGAVLLKAYYIILPDEAAWTACLHTWEELCLKENCIYIDVSGEQEAVENYIGAAIGLANRHLPNAKIQDGNAGRGEIQSMNGGLLFLGIFFGIIFMMCMILIMYYKQITEGFEDKNNFDIMQQIGMSEREVRATIQKQIFMVFFIPLAGAAVHTAAGLPMAILLLSAIKVYDMTIILWSSAAVLISFCLFYIGSYLLTARAYLHIVRKMV